MVLFTGPRLHSLQSRLLSLVAGRPDQLPHWGTKLNPRISHGSRLVSVAHHPPWLPISRAHSVEWFPWLGRDTEERHPPNRVTSCEFQESEPSRLPTVMSARLDPPWAARLLSIPSAISTVTLGSGWLGSRACPPIYPGCHSCSPWARQQGCLVSCTCSRPGWTLPLVCRSRRVSAPSGWPRTPCLLTRIPHHYQAVLLSLADPPICHSRTPSFPTLDHHRPPLALPHLYWTYHAKYLVILKGHRKRKAPHRKGRRTEPPPHLLTGSWTLRSIWAQSRLLTTIRPRRREIRAANDRRIHPDTNARLAAKVTPHSVDFPNTNNSIASRRSRKSSVVSTVIRPTRLWGLSRCTYELIHCRASVKSVARRSPVLGYSRVTWEPIRGRNPSLALTVAEHSLTDPTCVLTSKLTRTSRNTAVKPAQKHSAACHCSSNTRTEVVLVWGPDFRASLSTESVRLPQLLDIDL